MRINKTKLHDYKYIINGGYGYCTFEINKDNELILTFADGKIYRKGLQIELTLPRVRTSTIEKHVSKFYNWIKENEYKGDVPQ